MPESQPTGSEQPGGLSENEIAIDRAELEALKVKATSIDAFEDDAKTLGFTDFNEYRAFLEEKKLAEIDGQQTPTVPTTPTTPQVSTPTVPPANTPTTMGLSQEDLAMIDRANRMSANSFIKSDWLEFKLQQSERPEDERSVSTKEELTAMIQGPMGESVARAAQDAEHGGNLFSAAAFMKDTPKNSKELIALANKRAEAMKVAKETANINTSTATPIIPAESNKSESGQELADLIAPDTVEVE